MDFVTPQLAVGSRTDAENGAALASHGIDAVLSLVPLARPAGVTRQLSLALSDQIALPGQLIDEALDFLLDQTARDRRVLVHCEMGISRSPALAAAYLHVVQGIGIHEAVQQVQQARPIVAPHPLLIDSLLDYFGTEQPADLSGNENPLGPSPHAMAALHRLTPRAQRYPDKNGSALRARLAQRCDVSAAQIVLGNGASELIDLAVRALLQPGDEMLLPVPAFPSYRSAALRAGAKSVTLPMPAGHCDVDALIAAITPATRLVVVVTPHNPYGTVLSSRDLGRLSAALPPQACLLLDEAYREFAAPEDLPELPSLFCGEQRVFVIRSLSKAYGLAGVRIGYGIAAPEFAAQLDALRQPFNTSSLAQAAALAAIDDNEFLARSIAHNAEGRAQIERGLAALGIEYTPSQANFVLFRAGPEGVEELAARGILVKCLARFGLPGHARVTVGRAADNARFLAAMAELQASAMARTNSAYA